jgi:hypothetical protein
MVEGVPSKHETQTPVPPKKKKKKSDIYHLTQEN